MAPPTEAPSHAALDRRLRRLMKPNGRGDYKVSDRIREMWDDLATRDEVFRMFADCQNDPDRGPISVKFT